MQTGYRMDTPMCIQHFSFQKFELGGSLHNQKKQIVILMEHAFQVVCFGNDAGKERVHVST